MCILFLSIFLQICSWLRICSSKTPTCCCKASLITGSSSSVCLLGIVTLSKKSFIDFISPEVFAASLSILLNLILIVSPIFTYFSKLNRLIKNFLRLVSVAFKKSNKSIDD